MTKVLSIANFLEAHSFSLKKVLYHFLHKIRDEVYQVVVDYYFIILPFSVQLKNLKIYLEDISSFVNGFKGN